MPDLSPFDLNADGQVTPIDALCALRDAAGLPSTAHCPQPLVHERIAATGIPAMQLAHCILEQCAGLPLSAGCSPIATL